MEFDPEIFYVADEEEYVSLDQEIPIVQEKEPDVPRATLEPAKIPRYTIQEDVEQAVLAIILDRSEAIRAIESSRFNPELFTGSRFHIAQAIKFLIGSEVVPDFVSICIRLESTIPDLFDSWGGRSHLRDLTQFVPYGDYTFTHFFEVLEDALRRRQLYDMGDSIKSLATDSTHDSVDSVLESQSRLVDILAHTNNSNSFVSLSDAKETLIDEILERALTPAGSLIGLSTGFRDIDHYCKGLKPGKLYVLAARPAGGKSALALNISAKVALDDNKPVVFFSLEMGAVELTERLVSGRAQVPFVHIAGGDLSENDWANIAKVNKELADAPLYIEESPSTTMVDIRSRCQTIYAAKGSLGLVVVDYLQLMNEQASKKNRQEVVSGISRDLKVLSKDFNCPVLALSQLNRNLESRPNKRPMASDLRESGALEQDADFIAFLYRDETYHSASANQGITEFIVAKNRSGESGTAHLAFMNQFVQFQTLATT